MISLKRYFGGLLMGALAALAFSAPARANAAFDFNLALAGGATAVGQAMFTQSGPTDFIVTYDVTTSGANGFHYVSGAGLPSPQFSDGNLYLTFNRPGYNGFLQLEFTTPISGNGSYTLNLAGSFECIGGYQSANIADNTCGHGTKRSLAVASVLDLPAVSVPEPGSLALLGTALLGLGFAAAFRRRRGHLTGRL